MRPWSTYSFITRSTRSSRSDERPTDSGDAAGSPWVSACDAFTRTSRAAAMATRSARRKLVMECSLEAEEEAPGESTTWVRYLACCETRGRFCEGVRDEQSSTGGGRRVVDADA